MATTRFRYFAVKPFTAEHPVGSGIIVQYNPADEVPAGEWKGAAVDAMVENDKLARMAEVVYEPGDPQYGLEPGVRPLPGGEPPAQRHWGVGTLDESDARTRERGELEPEAAAPDEELEADGEPDEGEPEPLGQDAYPINRGGGYWELSDGERVYGRNKAKLAQQALNSLTPAG